MYFELRQQLESKIDTCIGWTSKHLRCNSNNWHFLVQNISNWRYELLHFWLCFTWCMWLLQTAPRLILECSLLFSQTVVSCQTVTSWMVWLLHLVANIHALSPTKKRLAGFRVELTRYGPMITFCSVLGLKDILRTVDLNKLTSSSVFWVQTPKANAKRH
jgi:hypothetical protein